MRHHRLGGALRRIRIQDEHYAARPTTKPITSIRMKPGTDAGAIPAKVSENIRPIATAGLGTRSSW